MARCSKCDSKLNDHNVIAGECRFCIFTQINNLDTMVKDEFGAEVWAKTLAARYRGEMERHLWHPSR